MKAKGIMERAFKIGCRVIFFDSHRQAHNAIVTNWFHGGPDGQTLEEYTAAKRAEGVTSPIYTPCCNLVFVSEDTSKSDPYGRQIERQTSCGYGRHNPTPFIGQCWAWPDEEEEARGLAAEAFSKAVAK